MGLAHVFPCEAGNDTFKGGIAAFLPEGIEGAVGCGAGGVICGAEDGAEGCVGGAEGFGVGFARIEEGMADSVAPKLGEEDTFCAIKDIFYWDGHGGEGGGEFGGVILHGRSGGRTHKAGAIEGPNDHGPFAFPVAFQIVALVVEIPVIEIGPCAEDLDAELGNVIEGCVEGLSGEGGDADHCET